MHSLDQELQNAIQKISSGDVKGARKILEKLQQFKSTSEIERLIGITYAFEQRYSESIDWFVNSIKLDNQNSAAHMNLGSAYQAIDLDISALTCFNESILINHKNVDALKNRGNLLFKQKNIRRPLRIMRVQSPLWRMMLICLQKKPLH
jgi:tetratricopeptide (TPR) repeat protein